MVRVVRHFFRQYKVTKNYDGTNLYRMGDPAADYLERYLNKHKTYKLVSLVGSSDLSKLIAVFEAEELDDED